MNDVLLWLVIGAADTGIIWWLVRDRRRRKYHTGDLQYSRKINSIHDLEAVAQQLEALGQSITQIELARVHKMKGVTVSVPDILSQQHESTILIDGRSDASRYLLETLNAEKIRLRQELDRKLTRLYKYGTTELTTGEELSVMALSPAPAEVSESRTIVRKSNDSTHVSRTGGAV